MFLVGLRSYVTAVQLFSDPFVPGILEVPMPKHSLYSWLSGGLTLTSGTCGQSSLGLNTLQIGLHPTVSRLSYFSTKIVCVTSSMHWKWQHHAWGFPSQGISCPELIKILAWSHPRTFLWPSIQYNSVMGSFLIKCSSLYTGPNAAAQAATGPLVSLDVVFCITQSCGGCATAPHAPASFFSSFVKLEQCIWPEAYLKIVC